MKITDNKARITNNGKKVVQDVTYSNGKNQTRVTVEYNGSGKNPKITGIEKQSK